MYSLVVTPPIVYIKVQDLITSRGFASLCEELTARHIQLGGSYDSIFIDLGKTFELDLNFRDVTRNFFHMMKDENKQIVILNPTEKTAEAIKRQGLTRILKVKTTNALTPAASGEFDSKEISEIDAACVTQLMKQYATQVFGSIGISPSMNLISSPDVAGEVYSVGLMTSDRARLVLGLRFRKQSVIASLIHKTTQATAVDLSTMNRWSGELLNMIISQIATSEPNQKWSLKKIGQPVPSTSTDIQIYLSEMKNLDLVAFPGMEISLTYAISNREVEESATNENLTFIKTSA